MSVKRFRLLGNVFFFASQLDALSCIEEDASEEALTERESVSTVRSSKKAHPVIDIDSIGM